MVSGSMAARQGGRRRTHLRGSGHAAEEVDGATDKRIARRHHCHAVFALRRGASGFVHDLAWRLSCQSLALRPPLMAPMPSPRREGVPGRSSKAPSAATFDRGHIARKIE